METPNHNSDIHFIEDLDTIEWIDIENAELDSYNYLNDIENFFRQDSENNMSEEKIFWSKLPAPQLPELITLTYPRTPFTKHRQTEQIFIHTLKPVNRRLKNFNKKHIMLFYVSQRWSSLLIF